MVRRATDEYGAPNGQAQINPMLGTRKFEVKLENGETNKIISNQIVGNLYFQLDHEVHDIF